ncbi:hypothetical protein B9R80_002425 [Salmonella enterica]|nr:hypothetical protein [Salmonella enterica]
MITMILIWVAAMVAGVCVGLYGAWKADKGNYQLSPNMLTSKPLKAVGLLFWVLALYLTYKGLPGLLALVLVLNVVWVWWLQDRTLTKAKII